MVGSSAMISRGIDAKRQSDHHALAHAAGKLVGILIDAPLGRRNADFVQEFDGTVAGRLLAQIGVGLDGLRSAGGRWCRGG